MQTLFSEELISLRELALLVSALVLLIAAAPQEVVDDMPEQQPVNATVPAEQNTDVQLNAA